MSKSVFITGVTSQDSSHLIEYLLPLGLKIYGLKRRSSTDTTWRIRHLLNDIEIVNGDMTDGSSLNKAIQLIKPEFVFSLAAQSFVKASWDAPEATFDVNAMGIIRLLESIRSFGKKDTRVYQASSSEMFGKVQETPQTEITKFYPRSVYGCSKAAAHYICVNYRESYNMFISCGISFNHESYRRGLEFVSRKISYGVAKIHCHLADSLELGNLDSKRDFGYAPEFVEAFWKILQLDNPDDFVLATGETHSIREFVKTAFEAMEIYNWQDYVKQNPLYMRPAEVDLLLGDSRKAKQAIDWQPKTSFQELVKIMVEADVDRLSRGDRFE
jgi:GDPmannose 4,6-dehydratase